MIYESTCLIGILQHESTDISVINIKCLLYILFRSSSKQYVLFKPLAILDRESYTNNIELFWSFDHKLKHSELDPKLTSSLVLMAENMEKVDD